MNKYTVILTCPQYAGDEYPMIHVKAATVDNAIRAAKRQAMESSESTTDDWEVVAVIAGHHSDVNEPEMR